MLLLRSRRGALSFAKSVQLKYAWMCDLETRAARDLDFGSAMAAVSKGSGIWIHGAADVAFHTCNLGTQYGTELERTRWLTDGTALQTWKKNIRQRAFSRSVETARLTVHHGR